MEVTLTQVQGDDVTVLGHHHHSVLSSKDTGRTTAFEDQHVCFYQFASEKLQA